MNTPKYTHTVFILLLTFLFSNVALAVTLSCKHAKSGKTIHTKLSGVSSGGFNVIKSGTQTLINQHWNNFGMEKRFWDNAWGFNKAWDANTPLNRTFRALELLRVSKNNKFKSNVMLNSAYTYSKNSINHLRADCASNFSPAGAEFHKKPGIAYIFQNGFGGSIMWLSTTVLHEARHKHKGHNGGKGCPRKGSCDLSYGYNGSNAYELAYSWWYGVAGKKSTKFTRQMGLDNARRLQNTAFNKRPAFNIATTAK